MNNDERELWRHHDIQCVMISCCAGAELQVRRVGRGPLESDTTEVDDVLLREMYPSKSDLYERARMLQAEYEQRSPTT